MQKLKVKCSDGRVRTAEVNAVRKGPNGEATGKVKINRLNVTGVIKQQGSEFQFHQHGANAAVLPAWA